MMRDFGSSRNKEPAEPGDDPRYCLHYAVWDDNLPLLGKLLEEKRDLEVRDPRNNTPLLLAYRLGRTKAARMLLAAGADPKARTPEGFEAIQVAALTGNPDLTREAVLAFLKETDAAFERRLPSLQQTLQDMPDFELRMEWKFASWIPLVSRLLPSDTFTIYKRGSSLRLDSTLLAFSGLSWERGALSLIVMGHDMPHPGSSYVLDHDMKTAADARCAFTAPEDVSQQDWVRKLLTKELKATDFWSRDAVIVPVLNKGAAGAAGGLLSKMTSLFIGTPSSDVTPRGRVSEGQSQPSPTGGFSASPAGAASPAVDIDDAGSDDAASPSSSSSVPVDQQASEPPALKREAIGVWENCGVYELRNLCVRDVTHPPVLPEQQLPLKAWWKPEYSRQVKEGGALSPTSATGGGGGASPSSSSSGASKMGELVDDVPEARLGLLKRALRAIREGKIDELAGTQDASELEGMWFGADNNSSSSSSSSSSSGGGDKDGRKPGYTVAHYSFNEYFGHNRPSPPVASHTGPKRGISGSGSSGSGHPDAEPYVHSDGKLHKATAAVAEFKAPNLTTEDKVLDLKMAFSKDFPITVSVKTNHHLFGSKIVCLSFNPQPFSIA